MALMFGLGSLFYAALLFVNAVAVLSEDRFLARVGWAQSGSAAAGTATPSFYGEAPPAEGVKTRLVALITATRTLLRIPLVVVNALVIVYQLVLG